MTVTTPEGAYTLRPQGSDGVVLADLPADGSTPLYTTRVPLPDNFDLESLRAMQKYLAEATTRLMPGSRLDVRRNVYSVESSLFLDCCLITFPSSFRRGRRPLSF